MGIKLTREDFVRKSIEIHGDIYDYTKASYLRALLKVTIICKEHGEFQQAPSKHMDGQGCPNCKKNTLRNHFASEGPIFIKRSQEIYGDIYGYDKVVYLNSKTKVEILCKKHSKYFWKDANHHLGGKQGCPLCGTERGADAQRKPIEEVISLAEGVHGRVYNYSKSVYKSMSDKIVIVCPTHGEFYQTGSNHIHNEVGCPSCNTSKQELEVISYIESLGLKILTNDRTILKPLELDIVIPSLNIAIEYNGVYYHSEIFGKDNRYHLNKTILCNKKGYRLIHIFEDEWVFKKDIVKNRLAHILNKSDKRYYARKLEIRKLTYNEAYQFLEETHIQGSGSSWNTAYGLLDNNNIVACMTFCKSRFEDKSNYMELLRFSSKHSIVGGFSKLLTTFIRSNPEVISIISYSDKRWSEGAVYLKNNFLLTGTSAPGYDYVGKDNRRINRQHFMKHKLSNLFKNFKEELTEVENCKANGYHRIWNCGMDRWELKLR